MRGKIAAALAGLVCAGALALAPAASAATEFGSNCAAETNGEESIVLLGLSHTDPLPNAAPVSGVITSWRINIGPGAEVTEPGFLSQTLQIYRPAGGGLYTVVGESSPRPLSTGVNAFTARIPVQAGDLIGNYGVLTFYCQTGSGGDVLGYFEDEPVTLGATKLFGTDIGFKLPILAVIEPDADGDGYGDETQDGCPQSAAYQTPCPVVVVSTSMLAGKTAVRALVATSLSTPVKVTGTVALGKGKQAKLSAAKKTVAAGTIKRFKLEFPNKLTDRLKELGPGRSLQLTVTASATNLAGAAGTAKAKLKLKGQG